MTQTPEEKHLAQKAWRQANPEKQRAYRAANREKMNAYARAYFADNRDKQRAAKRKNRSGFTPEMVSAALVRQDGRCGNLACDQVLDVRMAHADHDHQTKHPRGLLCRECNTTLGHAKDSIPRLRGLAMYLEEYA